MKAVFVALYLSIMGAFVAAPVFAGWSHQDVLDLADHPFAMSTGKGQCVMTGAVVRGDNPTPRAVVSLAVNGVVVATARTNFDGVYQVEVPAQPGDIIQEVEVRAAEPLVGTRMRSNRLSASKPTAQCMDGGQVRVGEAKAL